MTKPALSDLYPRSIRAWGMEFAVESGPRVSVLVNKDFSEEVDARAFGKCLWGEPGVKVTPGEKMRDTIRTSRGTVVEVELPSGRKVVFRRFLRGGMLAWINRDVYLQVGDGVEDTRPFREVTTLAWLRSQGVNVPVPVGASSLFSLGGMVYRGMIATESVADSSNLLLLGAAAKGKSELEKQFCDGCYQAGLEANKMLRAGVFHVDLHPGNVLLCADGKAALIDFDRAEQIDPEADFHVRRIKTVVRWLRSTRKHGLRELADKPFFAGIEGKSSWEDYEG